MPDHMLPPPHDPAAPVDAAGAGPFDCHAAVMRLWDYLDGELREADVRAVDAHLAECDKCPPHFRFERAFLRAVRRARRDPPPPGAPDGAGRRLRDRVVAVLAAEGYEPP
jgi:anti-sigma factor RsiW